MSPGKDSQAGFGSAFRFPVTHNVFALECIDEELAVNDVEILASDFGANQVMIVNLTHPFSDSVAEIVNNQVLEADMGSFVRSLEELLNLVIAIQAWVSADEYHTIVLLYSSHQLSVASVVYGSWMSFVGLAPSPEAGFDFISEKRSSVLFSLVSNLDESSETRSASKAGIQSGLMRFLGGNATSEKQQNKETDASSLTQSVSSTTGFSAASVLRRANRGLSLSLPSLTRYLRYFGEMVAVHGFPQTSPLILNHIVLSGVPDMDGKGGCRPLVRVWVWSPPASGNGGAVPHLLYDSSMMGAWQDDLLPYYSSEDLMIWIPVHVLLFGDLVITCHHVNLPTTMSASQYQHHLQPPSSPITPTEISSRRTSLSETKPATGDSRAKKSSSFQPTEPMFTYSCHTGFILHGVERAGKSELDMAVSDPRFSDDESSFFVDFVFSEPLPQAKTESAQSGQHKLQSFLSNQIGTRTQFENDANAVHRENMQGVVMEIRLKAEGSMSQMQSASMPFHRAGSAAEEMPSTPISRECSSKSLDTFLSEHSKGGAPAPPPPPPPLPGSGRGPPPPPPPGFSSSKNSSVNTRKLYWKTIPQNQIASDSLWSKFHLSNSPVEVDRSQLIDLFTVRNEQSNASAQTKAKEKTDENSTVQTVLNSRRANNIGILLQSIKLSVAELRTQLMTGADDGISLDQLINIGRILPTADEVIAVAEFRGDRSKLSKSDEFVQAVGSIPRVQDRIGALIFRRQFHELADDLRQKASYVVQGSEAIMSSDKLVKLFEMILVIGNTLNRGSAKAFTLESVRRLADTRATTGSTTLLHFVASQVIKFCPDVADLPSELEILKFSTQVSLPWLHSSLEDLEGQVESVSSEALKSSQEGVSSFANSLEAFVAKSKQTMQDLRLLIEKSALSCVEVGRFFGEEDGEPSTDSMGLLLDFVTNFGQEIKTCAAKEKSRREAEARAKRRQSIATAAPAGRSKFELQSPDIDCPVSPDVPNEAAVNIGDSAGEEKESPTSARTNNKLHHRRHSLAAVSMSAEDPRIAPHPNGISSALNSVIHEETTDIES